MSSLVNKMSIVYYGGDAENNRINLYDASRSYEGFARTLSILGHYYVTGSIISKAPASRMPLYLESTEEGSFKQNVLAAALGSVLATPVIVPFTIFATRAIEKWVPGDPKPDPQMAQIIQLLEKQNQILQEENSPNDTQSKALMESADKVIEENIKEIDIIRSITAPSFKQIFRPIETGSAKHVGIIGGLPSTPQAVVDTRILARIEADRKDDNEVIMLGVVESFSRSSKIGTIYSRDFDRGFRFKHAGTEKLARQDDFSWSQYSGKPIRITGKFVRFFDGRVKKLLVYSVERVQSPEEIEEYFSSDRELRIP